jgi:phosphonate transport system substrate-binding protein
MRQVAMQSIRNRKPKHSFPVVFVFLVAVTFSLGLNTSYSNPEFTMGVFPYLPASRIQELYIPVAEDLSTALKKPVNLKTRDSFQNFRVAVEKQEYDLIFIQPFDYVRTAAPHGYQAISHPIGDLKGVFVVLRDSHISSLADLKGKRIAMPPKDAAVSLLGLKLLIDNSINIQADVSITYQSNHFACMKQLLIKKVEACVTADAPKKMFERRSEAKLEVLETTQAIPTTLFAIHKRVPQKERQEIVSRIVDWNRSEAGRDILNGLQFKSFVPADDHSYDIVRNIWNSVKSQ